MNRAIFFDKDGTLIKNVPYNVRPELIELMPGAADVVRDLRRAGFLIFIVSNQSGVARGFFAEEDLTAVWQKLNELAGARFDGFYFCPHLETGVVEKYRRACNCRKPAAGMLLEAAREHEIDLKNSWMIGDDAKDAEAGRRAGCRTILLGRENVSADFAASDLASAVRIILSDENGENLV